MNEYKRINTSQKDNFKKHLVSSHQLENNINNFLTGNEKLSSSSGHNTAAGGQAYRNFENNQKGNFHFSSPMKKLKNLRNKSSATSTSSVKKSSLGMHTGNSDKLSDLDDRMLFGLGTKDSRSAKNNISSDIPIRTTSLSAFGNGSGYNTPLRSTEKSKIKDNSFNESLKLDTTKHPENNLRNASAISSSFDLNITPLHNNFNHGLNINDPPSFTPPKRRQQNSSRSKKRFNLMKCCICEETVKEKTSDEKILTLECGHVCHDSCIYLHMLMEKEKNHKLNKEMLFPFCELCNDGVTKCKPENEASRDELYFKVLTADDEHEDIVSTEATNEAVSSLDPEKEKTMELLNKDIDYLDGLPVPDFEVKDPAEIKKESEQNTHMTPPNQIISVFPDNDISPKGGLMTPETYSSTPPTVIRENFKDIPAPLKRQSILKQNLNNYKMTNGSPGMNRFSKNRTSILHQSSISRASTLSKKQITTHSPKPIVKKLNSALPSPAIFSSINTSVDPKPKSKPKSMMLHKSLTADSDSDDELMIVQIEGDHHIQPKKSFLKKHSHSNSLDLQKSKNWGKFNDSVSTQTSENLINVVKDRLNLVHQLIERHSDQLNKKNIDSDLGLLRICNVFEVCKVLDNKTKDSFYLCKCYLFEKMLILDFFDKRIGSEFQMIKISSESINVDAVNEYVFRVSCLTSTNIDIFQFRSLDKKDSKILEKWISALLNFDLELYDQPFPIDNENKMVSSSIGTIEEDDDSNTENSLFQDFIIKKSNNKVSTSIPIKSYNEVEDLVLILQLDSEKKIKISENSNLVNSIKSLNFYFIKKSRTLKFVILDQKSKVLCVGSSNDVLNQLSGHLKFEQIRGKKLTESSWSSSVLQKYFMNAKESKLNVVVISNTEMDFEQNCLFNDYYTPSLERVLKIHVGFLNVDYSEEINDLVEINNWFDMMEILCFSLNLEFGQDDLDSDEDEEYFTDTEKQNNSTVSSNYADITPITPLDFDKEKNWNSMKLNSGSSNKTESLFDTEALYNYL